MDDVLCECGHEVADHDKENGCWVEMCKCPKHVPLATFAQLRESWDLVGELCKVQTDRPNETVVLLRAYRGQARRIRGEKGVT